MLLSLSVNVPLNILKWKNIKCGAYFSLVSNSNEETGKPLLVQLLFHFYKLLNNNYKNLPKRKKNALRKLQQNLLSL